MTLFNHHEVLFLPSESSTLGYSLIFKTFLLWNFGKTPSLRRQVCFALYSPPSVVNIFSLSANWLWVDSPWSQGPNGLIQRNESYLTTYIKTTGGTMVLLFLLSQNTVSSATTVCQLRVGMTVPLSRKRWPVILVRKPAPIFITIQHRETWLCQKNVMPENVAQNQPVTTRSSARHLLQKELQSRSVKSTAARVTCAMEPEYHWPVRFCSWHAPF